MIEYALTLSLVAIASLTCLQLLGTSAQASFEESGDAIMGAVGGGNNRLMDRPPPGGK